MQFALFAALALAPPAWAPSLTEDDRWHRVVLPERSLQFAMPVQPTIRDRVTETIVGDVRTRVWSAEGPGFSVSVSLSRLPLIAAFFSSRNGLFDRATEAMMEQVGGIAETVAEHDGWFPRELGYSLHTPGGAARGRAWFSFVERDLVVIDGWSSPDAAAVVSRFFREVSP